MIFEQRHLRIQISSKNFDVKNNKINNKFNLISYKKKETLRKKNKITFYAVLWYTLVHVYYDE